MKESYPGGQFYVRNAMCFGKRTTAKERIHRAQMRHEGHMPEMRPDGALHKNLSFCPIDGPRYIFALSFIKPRKQKKYYFNYFVFENIYLIIKILLAS